MKTRVKLRITLAAALVGLASAEIAARSLRSPLQPMPTSEGDLVQPSPDPRLRFESRPGARQTIRYWNFAGGLEREARAEINSHGFRGPVVEKEKPPDVLRIAAIGDSHTFGAGVADDEAWPARLEHTIRGSSGGRPGAPRYEVMNCGVSGFDTEEVMAWLEMRVLPFEPDLVVYALFANDTNISKPRKRTEESEPGLLMRLVRPGRGGTVGWLRGHSALADIVASGLFQRLRLRQWAESQKVLFREDFEGWIRARAAIVRARDLSRARGAGFAVILFPFLLRADGELLSSGANRALRRFCAAENIPYFDPAPLFEGLDVEALHANARDLHAGAEAHRIVGEGVARWIEAEKLIEKGGNR